MLENKNITPNSELRTPNLKIGFDAKRAFVNSSGLGNYSRDIIRSMYELYPQNKYYLFTPETETDLLHKEYQKNIVTTDAKTRIGKARWRSLRMGEDIKNNKIDIFHGLSNELPANINICDAKKVVTIHDLIFIKFPQLYSYLDRKIYNRKSYNACKLSDKIIATSSQTKSDIIKYFEIPKSKIEVIYQTYNQSFKKKLDLKRITAIKQKYNLPGNYILTVGTIERRKNALNVIKAIYYFDLNIKYVLVGKKTSYMNELVKWAKSHKILDRILILNNIDNDDMPAVYQAADLFIYPSIYEGFGIPILEAFSSNIPVITGDSGSTAEISGNAAVQVEALNPKSIGIAIKSILESEELKADMIEAGKNRIKLFDREIVCNNMMDFYKNL
ncbi:MAG TPA: glycosyltransferase family 1 protein [Bacteroidales bacterium]|nr:glycosyltransferase family 1 protein [Bacteroidales bacterium]